MGQAKLKRDALIKAQKPCIFCGGIRLATTEEHCPPRSLFKDRNWPAGFSFPACEACNGGTSDDDLWVAFLANLEEDPTRRKQGRGLMFQLKRQDPQSLQEMFGLSALQTRAAAKKMNMQPEPGQALSELGIVKVTDAAHKAVGTLAGKLSKAMFHRATGEVFPTNGGIMFHWFTNAQLHEHGQIPVLEAMRQFAAMQQPVVRNGKDLQDQFDCRHSVDVEGRLHLLQVTFGTMFGFVSIFSAVPGQLEGFAARLEDRFGREHRPFAFVSSNDPARLS